MEHIVLFQQSKTKSGFNLTPLYGVSQGVASFSPLTNKYFIPPPGKNKRRMTSSEYQACTKHSAHNSLVSLSLFLQQWATRSLLQATLWSTRSLLTSHNGVNPITVNKPR